MKTNYSYLFLRFVVHLIGVVHAEVIIDHREGGHSRRHLREGRVRGRSEARRRRRDGGAASAAPPPTPLRLFDARYFLVGAAGSTVEPGHFPVGYEKGHVKLHAGEGHYLRLDGKLLSRLYGLCPRISVVVDIRKYQDYEICWSSFLAQLSLNQKLLTFTRSAGALLGGVWIRDW